jgi:hypothetical protein
VGKQRGFISRLKCLLCNFAALISDAECSCAKCIFTLDAGCVAMEHTQCKLFDFRSANTQFLFFLQTTFEAPCCVAKANLHDTAPLF